jgi:hypothetical protein
MKAKVLRKFRDKHTGEIHNPGDVITISAKRFEEILTVAPLVEKVETKKEAAE